MITDSQNKILKDRILRHDRMVPRYTSYPPAPCFHTDTQPATRQHWLTTVPADQPVSLYLHIPFCPQLCYYCGCHTFATSRTDLMHNYCADMLHEISLSAALLPQRLRVAHIHFGGGSPTAIPPEMLVGLLDSLRSHFDVQPHCEIALEADPRQLNADAIRLYCTNGITRFSLGVQETDMAILTAINRPQPFALTELAIEALRNHGISDINLDLMYGLPGQTVGHVQRTMDRVIPLQPDRIAFFGYAHVPWMKKHMTCLDAMPLPDNALRFDMHAMGYTRLTQAGYRMVGIDHFARPGTLLAQEGKLHRNFQGYTTDDCKTLIGFGASAISSFPQGYMQNLPNLRAYHDQLTNDALPVYKYLQTTPDDHFRRDIINHIMCDLHVDLNAVCQQYGKRLDDLAGAIQHLQDLIADDLVLYQAGVLYVRHPHMARLAASAFDIASPRQTEKPRHSAAI